MGQQVWMGHVGRGSVPVSHIDLCRARVVTSCDVGDVDGQPRSQASPTILSSAEERFVSITWLFDMTRLLSLASSTRDCLS